MLSWQAQLCLAAGWREWAVLVDLQDAQPEGMPNDNLAGLAVVCTSCSAGLALPVHGGRKRKEP